MSFTRLFRWTCDICACHCETASYGGLPGWKWMTVDGATMHACTVCARAMIAADAATLDPENSKHLRWVGAPKMAFLTMVQMRALPNNPAKAISLEEFEGKLDRFEAKLDAIASDIDPLADAAFPE